MKAKAVPSSWVERDGRRLDCNPYMSGALEARVLLEGLKAKKERLADLTAGFKGGIYNGPQFKRNYVDSAEHGVQFLTGGDVLSADTTRLPFLSRRDAHSPKLKYLRLERGMTIISCSGAIGRMAYVREDFAGVWSSQDVMKVAPDAAKIPPGYLYAYLSSKFGVPLVVGGTYGAIIQHIEPEHIANLPVPRLGKKIEATIHALIDESARELTTYARLCAEATGAVLAGLGISDVAPACWSADRRALGWTETFLSAETFRALNFDPRAQELWRMFADANSTPLGSICKSQYFKGKNIFKRIDADPEFGVMLLGQRNAFHFRPEGRWISRRSVEKQGLGVPAFSTLIPSHGTLGEHELYCRALIVTPSMRDFVFSGDFFRCVPDEHKVHPGYLYAFLRSNAAFRVLRSISVGGKQQEQHPALMWRLPVPRLHPKRELEIHELIEQAVRSYDVAVRTDQRARNMVEDAIEKGATN